MRVALPRSPASEPTVAPQNSFTALTILAVVLVVLRHSGSIFGAESEVGGWNSVPVLGIYILFAVSGYLLVGSWERRPNVGTFAVARVIRIIPSLAIVVLLCVFALGPALSTLDGAEYFASEQTRDYLGNIVLRLQYFLPGVFAGNPYPDVVNGSLWSLPAQFAAAFFVPLVSFVRPWIARGVLWMTLAVASAAASQLPQLALYDIWGSNPPDVLRIWPAFFVAAGLRVLVGKIGLRWGIAATGVLVLSSIVWPAAVQWVDWFVIPIAVVALGGAALPVIKHAGRWGNPTFGIYLTGFPIQQTIVATIGTEHAASSVLVSLVLSLGFGYALNRGVERPLARVHRAVLRRSRTRQPASSETV
jgi:peptidoglycan/LPS O-acetylase OafA/YrhL